MPWARIDDEFDDHPKVLALLEHEQGVAAVGLWSLCLTWAYRNTLKRGKVPGLIPPGLPRRFVGPGARPLALLLTVPPPGFEVGLWEPQPDDGGWLIHDFTDYLATEKTREARSAAGKRGAAKRWANHSPNGTGSEADGNLLSDDGNLPEPCQDADSNAIANDGSRAPARRAIPNGIAPVPDPEPEGQNLTAAQERRQRAKRIPDDFSVTAEMVAWARQRCPHVDGRAETEKFENHWRSAGGQSAAKLDWVLTWKNWLIRAEEQAPRMPSAAVLGSTTDDRVAGWQALKSGNQGGTVPPNTIPGSVIR